MKIGADELAPVTQLFTEDYMVLFLLENTLGAWWTAQRGSPDLPGYSWTYLRLNDDGSPVAGSFDGWPKTAAELKVLDPCMGSGHFLTFALPILAGMRQAEDGLSLVDAIVAVLRDNLFGLELDPRCSQIAAFNLALTAWKLAGHHFVLPSLQLACSGLGINAKEEDWVKLAGEDGLAAEGMRRLYSLFKDAPTLGSLIDPLRLKTNVYAAGAERVLPLLEEALKQEASTDESRELAITAQGVLAAFRILSGRFTLVATNVPYLGRGSQSALLAQYCAEFHADAKADLATCAFDRCNRFRDSGGTVAQVILQSWLFMGPYRHFRIRQLKDSEWNLIVRLGPRAFESITGEIVNVALCVLSERVPSAQHIVHAIEASAIPTPAGKAAGLKSDCEILHIPQLTLLDNPDARFALDLTGDDLLLSDFAGCFKGVATGGLPRFIHQFWEVDSLHDSGWECFQGAPRVTEPYGARDQVVLWQEGRGELYEYVSERLGVNGVGAWIRGEPAWQKRGVAVAQMSSLTCSLYTGELFDESTGAIIPHDPDHLSAIWAFCSDPSYKESVRAIDQSLKVPTLTLLKVPFDLSFWQKVAADKYPTGLPEPKSTDPTQWIFDGLPKGSTNPLQVAVARLVGYRWPRQNGSAFLDCQALLRDNLFEHSATDGIVCLSSVAGEESAGARLRTLLKSAFGDDYTLSQLLAGEEVHYSRRLAPRRVLRGTLPTLHSAAHSCGTSGMV